MPLLKIKKSHKLCINQHYEAKHKRIKAERIKTLAVSDCHIDKKMEETKSSMTACHQKIFQHFFFQPQIWPSCK